MLLTEAVQKCVSEEVTVARLVLALTWASITCGHLRLIFCTDLRTRCENVQHSGGPAHERLWDVVHFKSMSLFPPEAVHFVASFFFAFTSSPPLRLSVVLSRTNTLRCSCFSSCQFTTLHLWLMISKDRAELFSLPPKLSFV